MSTTTANARDEMLAIVKAALDALPPGLVVYWPGDEEDGDNTPPAEDRWVRITIKHDDGGQASLAGADGKRRWRRTGHVYVQCFAPLAKGGLTVSSAMACAVRDAFQQSRSTPGGVWFRNANADDIGADRHWYNSNAETEFNYHEVK